MSPFVGPLISMFWTSGDVSSGFKARVGSALFALGGGIWVTLHIPWDSPLVLHLLTSWQPAWLLSWSLPHTCKGIGGSRTGDLSLHERTLNRLTYAGSASVKNFVLHIIVISFFHLDISLVSNGQKTLFQQLIHFRFPLGWIIVLKRKIFLNKCPGTVVAGYCQLDNGGGTHLRECSFVMC